MTQTLHIHTHITIQTDRGPLVLPPGSTVAQALETLLNKPEQTDAMATALNGNFVPRREREQVVLNDGDTLLCFAAITGG
jgi:sulfur carrier protein